MPSQGFSAGSSGSWTTPFGVNRVRVTAIGGGGSGFSDNDGNEVGGGGGAGAYARADFAVGANGYTINYNIGRGGAVVTDGSRNGNETRFTGPFWNLVARGGSGGRGTRVGGTASQVNGTNVTLINGGSGGSEDDNYNGGTDGSCGQPEITAARGGEGGSVIGGRCSYILVACRQVLINFFQPGFQARWSGRGGRGIGTGGAQQGCPGSFDGGNWGGGGGGTGNGRNSTTGRGGDGRGRIEWFFGTPTIPSFTSTDQNSNTGPSSTVQISWSTTFANDIDIFFGSNASGTLIASNVAASGTINYTTGVQSSWPSNSPAVANFFIRASGPGGTATATTSSNIRNDVNPSNITLPTTATGGGDVRLLTELEPETPYVVNLGQISGIDAPTSANTITNGLSISRNGGGFTTGNITFDRNDFLRLRFTTPEFNTSQTPSGTNGDGLAIGQYNPASGFTSYSFSLGPDNYTLNTRVRRPVIEEEFDVLIADGQYPFPDIDTVPGTEDQYQTESFVIDDIEIDTEIKTSDPDVQVSVNGGNFQDMREL